MVATAKEVDSLLRPVVKRFKEDARAAILQATEEMKNVLRVVYNSTPERRPAGMPTPRLQFRWEDEGQWICHYELVFPLREFDIRNDDKTNVAVVELGRTRVGGSTEPWQRSVARDRVPFRDGAHAQWDSAAFGNLPIFVISPDGSFAEVPQDPDQQKP